MENKKFKTLPEISRLSPVFKLKNGAEEVKPLVAVTVMALERVLEDRPFAFYDLVRKVRDSRHEIFAPSMEYLTKRGLLEPNGSVHDSVRNIVLSAVTGEGFDLILGNPVA